LFSGDKFGYVNFDDERLLGATKDDLNVILQIFYELYGSDLGNIILDEVQLVPGWEPFVSRLRDTKKV
jgi:Predicted ATPase (AAA+ superfamily)